MPVVNQAGSKSGLPRVSMNYLIHNEADIIEANIRYHASVGIDSFVVMDNGSTDGTHELVEKLARDFPITLLDRPQADYRQSEWKTEMAHTSRKQGAHWSIANDADEFWLPQSGNIAALLPRFGASCYCRRYNMIPEYEDFQTEKPWYKAEYTVKRPVTLAPEEIQHDDDVSIMLHRIHGKIIVKHFGLVRVHGGNHRASHLFNPLWKKNLSNMVVLHYPLRGKSKWLKTVARRNALLAASNPKMGNHYRRWAHMMQKSTLEAEIARLAPKKNFLHTLESFGIIDRFIRLHPEFTASYQRLLTSISRNGLSS